MINSNKFISILLVVSAITGCASGPTENARIYSGQWTSAQSIGPDTFLVEGYDTQDALNGARNQCAKMNRQFTMLQLTPHTSRTRATITFRCN